VINDENLAMVTKKKKSPKKGGKKGTRRKDPSLGQMKKPSQGMDC
jgi:hypothetical protein